MSNTHARTEILAGAIALGEATQLERLEYRRHLAECATCLQAFGGEHELERVSARVADARRAEIWEPDVRAPLMDRLGGRTHVAKYGLSFLGVCFLISIIGHLLIGSGISTMHPIAADPLVLNYDGTRITLERRSTRDAKPIARAVATKVVVVQHNVVTLTRTPIARIATVPVKISSMKQPVGAAHSVNSAVVAKASAPAESSGVPIWRRMQDQTIAQTTTKTISEPMAPSMTHSAESMQIAPNQIAASYSTREAMPLGGESAITPRPSQLAYDQGAEGTAVFAVSIDEHGTPTKCAITTSSGWVSLDDATCAAAMKARYSPKLLNGRPVSSVYRDAFTFHSSTTDSLPKPSNAIRMNPGG
ncbi:MAG: TonB family protein [Candidatus Eremiobacteraeota bacterium]|nr:TonB family protein [Candidatus Eremiobacteraeota bacterium]